jgi:hypothetical protein
MAKEYFENFKVLKSTLNIILKVMEVLKKGVRGSTNIQRPRYDKRFKKNRKVEQVKRRERNKRKVIHSKI